MQRTQGMQRLQRMEKRNEVKSWQGMQRLQKRKERKNCRE